jgi:hypothetical protein
MVKSSWNLTVMAQIAIETDEQTALAYINEQTGDLAWKPFF